MRRAATSYGLVFLCLIGVLLGAGGCFGKEFDEDMMRIVEQCRTLLVYDVRYLVEWGINFGKPFDDVEPTTFDFNDRDYLESFDNWLASSHPIAELRKELTQHRREDLTLYENDNNHTPVVTLVITPIEEVDEQEIEKIHMIVDECGYFPVTAPEPIGRTWGEG